MNIQAKDFGRDGNDDLTSAFKSLGSDIGAQHRGEKRSGMGGVSQSCLARPVAQTLHRDSQSTLPFDLWVRLGAAVSAAPDSTDVTTVAMRDMPNFMDQLKGVTQFTADERAALEVVVGRNEVGITELQDPTGAPFDTAAYRTHFSDAGWAIFVMSHDNKIYSMTHTVAYMHHSSFLAGAPAQSAGEWKVTNGQLDGITRKSGHYHPTEAMFTRMLGFLGTQQLNLANTKAAPGIAQHASAYEWFPAIDVLRAGGCAPVGMQPVAAP